MSERTLSEMHRDQIGKTMRWAEIYRDLHGVASALLEVCPADEYSTMLAALKRVEARAEKEATR